MTTTQFETCYFATYKGNPMICFKADEDDTFPFMFGKAKAKKLLAAIDAEGAEAVIEKLREVVKWTTQTARGRRFRRSPASYFFINLGVSKYLFF